MTSRNSKISDDELADWFVGIYIDIAAARGTPLAKIGVAGIQAGLQILLLQVGPKQIADFLESEAPQYRELTELYPEIFEPAAGRC